MSMAADKIRKLTDDQIEIISKDHERVNKLESRGQANNWRIHGNATIYQTDKDLQPGVFSTWREANDHLPRFAGDPH